MSVDEDSTSCYCLLEANRCHLLLEHPGRYALVGAPMNPDAAKRLRLAVFGCPDPSSALGFSLRVYCVDDTPNTFQVWRCLLLSFSSNLLHILLGFRLGNQVFLVVKPHRHLANVRPDSAKGAS